MDLMKTTPEEYLEAGYRWFIGTKRILAKPRTADQGRGYDVVYNADDDRFSTYASWSPAGPFEDAYRPTTGLTFGLALEALKKGMRVARRGWNGKGMWLALSPGRDGLPADRFWSIQNGQFALEQGGTADVLPCITMKTADGKILMGWLASQTDMLSEDWEIVPGIETGGMIDMRHLEETVRPSVPSQPYPPPAPEGVRLLPPEHDLDNVFQYHAPKGDQVERYQKIREAGKALALVIMNTVPSCADRSAAIRKVREAVMTANAGIAINE
jgi:hypothetical protein